MVIRYTRFLTCLSLFVAASGYASSWSLAPGWRPAVHYSGVSLDRSRRIAQSNHVQRLVMRTSPNGETEEVAPDAEEKPTDSETNDYEGTDTQATAKADENDITNSPVFLTKKIEVLESELEELDAAIAEQTALQQAEWNEWGPQIEKMRTEFEVIKRRTSEQRESADASERAQVLANIFPATDNFDRAKQYSKPKTEGEIRVNERYVAIGETLGQAFEQLGVVTIDKCGVPFDPLVHSAAMYQPSPDYPLDTIAEILEKGYKIGDILVRPATVVVSSGQQ